MPLLWNPHIKFSDYEGPPEYQKIRLDTLGMNVYMYTYIRVYLAWYIYITHSDNVLLSINITVFSFHLLSDMNDRIIGNKVPVS